jgi:hypothetical protein
MLCSDPAIALSPTPPKPDHPSPVQHPENATVLPISLLVAFLVQAFDFLVQPVVFLALQG